MKVFNITMGKEWNCIEAKNKKEALNKAVKNNIVQIHESLNSNASLMDDYIHRSITFLMAVDGYNKQGIEKLIKLIDKGYKEYIDQTYKNTGTYSALKSFNEWEEENIYDYTSEMS